MKDGIADGVESKAVQHLLYMAVGSASAVSTVIGFDWISDSVTDLEVEALRWLDNMDGETMLAASALAWLQDEVDPLEVQMVQRLSYVSYHDAGLAVRVIDLAWTQDGVEPIEVELVRRLSYVASSDATAALQIASMPFFETVEASDVMAVRSLDYLAEHEQTAFEYVMAHPALQNGITDDQALIIATLHSVEADTALIDLLLSPIMTKVERRTVDLPLAGNVVLAIIRTTPGAARSMDLLEYSVRAIEKFMDAPLPVNYVGVLYEDSLDEGAAGTNFGTHITIRPEYDVDDGSYEADYAPLNIAHEVAHYYWRGNTGWMDEGAAELTAAIVENARTGRSILPDNRPCWLVSTIAELEEADVSGGHICNYSLGERLFIDLYLGLGEEAFRQSFRALYLAPLDEDEEEKGFTHTVQAFGAESGHIVSRWYDGTVPYDLSRLDDQPVDPDLSAFNGIVESATIVIGEDDDSPVTEFASDVDEWIWLRLKYAYDVPEERSTELKFVEYFEDGFAFRERVKTVTAKPAYDWWAQHTAVGAYPPAKWAEGRYYVYVYEGDRKIAEAQYEVVDPTATPTVTPTPTPTPTPTSTLMGMIQEAGSNLVEAGSARFHVWGDYVNNCDQPFATKSSPDVMEIGNFLTLEHGPLTLSYQNTAGDTTYLVHWDEEKREWRSWILLSDGTAREITPDHPEDSLGQPIYSGPSHNLTRMLHGIPTYLTEEDILVTSSTEDHIQLRVLLTDPQRLRYQEDFRRIDFSVTLNVETLEIEGYRWRAQWKDHQLCNYEQNGALDAFGITLEAPPTH